MQSALLQEFYVILQRSLHVIIEVGISDIDSQIMHSDEGNEGEYEHQQDMHPGGEVVEFFVIKHHLLVPVVTDRGERNISWNTHKNGDYEEVEGLTHQMSLETHVDVAIDSTVR